MYNIWQRHCHLVKMHHLSKVSPYSCNTRSNLACCHQVVERGRLASERSILLSASYYIKVMILILSPAAVINPSVIEVWCTRCK